LIGAEVGTVAVNLVKMCKAAEKVTPIRTAVHGLERAQRGVDVVGIVVETGAQAIRVEPAGDGACFLGIHRAVHKPLISRSSNATTAPGSSTWALWPAPGMSQACAACVRNSCSDTMGSPSPRASTTGAVALAANESKGAPATANVRGSCA